jgi:hypothetical protein
MKVSEGDLPDSLERQEDENYFNKMIYQGHRMCEPISRTFNRPLKKIPFPADVYIVNNGENHSKRTSNIGIKRKIIRFLTPSFKVDDKFSNEFGIKY